MLLLLLRWRLLLLNLRWRRLLWLWLLSVGQGSGRHRGEILSLGTPWGNPQRGLGVLGMVRRCWLLRCWLRRLRRLCWLLLLLLLLLLLRYWRRLFRCGRLWGWC